MFKSLTISLLKGFSFSSSRFNSYKDVILLNSDIEKKFMRSSGPGGQSVNTTNSKAEVRVNITTCQAIDQTIMASIQKNYPSFVNKSNQLIVTCQTHKSQKANLQECIQKIQKIIYNCSIVQKERRYDIPAESQEIQEMRIESKRKKSEVKSRRKSTRDLY